MTTEDGNLTTSAPCSIEESNIAAMADGPKIIKMGLKQLTAPKTKGCSNTVAETTDGLLSLRSPALCGREIGNFGQSALWVQI